eukprot:6182277-Pleurochrysis_carterae.AAC.1
MAIAVARELGRFEWAEQHVRMVVIANFNLALMGGIPMVNKRSPSAPVVCKVSLNVHDHVGQIKGPGVRNEVAPGLSWDASSALRCLASSYATSTAVQSVAVLQASMDGRTVNGQKCVLSAYLRRPSRLARCFCILESQVAE